MPRAKRRPVPDDEHTAGELPAPPEAQASAQVLRQFRLIFNSVRKHFREVESRTGVGGAQVWALSQIRNHPGLGVTELAAAMDVHQSTASNLVRSLLARDLIRTEQGTTDRRSVKLTIRPAGRAVLRRVPGPFTGVLPKALSELDHKTLKRLQADLAVLIEQMGGDEDGSQTPLAQM